MDRGLPKHALGHVVGYVTENLREAQLLRNRLVPIATYKRRTTTLSPHESEKVERIARVPVNQLVMQKMMINQAYDNMGLQGTQLLATLFDGITLLPIVIPPVILIVGVLQVAPTSLKATPYLLSLEYAVLAMPFAYRSLDAGLAAIDFTMSLVIAPFTERP